MDDEELLMCLSKDEGSIVVQGMGEGCGSVDPYEQETQDHEEGENL